MKSPWFRHAASRRFAGVRIISRAGLLAIIAALVMGAGAPGAALAEEGGCYTLQCFCPLEWSEEWDGAGVFNEDESLDTVALESGGAVLLIHEIPLADGTVDGMIADRGDSLESGAAISALEETYADDSAEEALAGRTWENSDGETMYSFQQVQVWETNFLLSIEFIAAEDDFVDAWDSLESVLLIGSPILDDFDGEETAELIGG